MNGGLAPAGKSAELGQVEALLGRFAPGREIARTTTLDELGLSSLERVELLMELEQQFGTTIGEAEYSGACSVDDLYRLLGRSDATPAAAVPDEVLDFPRWNRGRFARFIRRTSLPSWVIPLARLFVWVRAEGLENLRGLEPPVIFASTHQSHFDVPSIFAAMPARWRYRLAPAMSKEFFRAHFFPRQHSMREWFTNSLNYYLACLMFNAFPFPQREAGARQTMRYAGELASESWCVLIFPEGKISLTGEIGAFQPGVGMMASRLGVPVVPIRIAGARNVLPKGSHFPRPGRVRVTIGPPLTLAGEDYAALAREVEDAVRRLD
jgi:1-acyl-sn-glycerol-3-phosphate acyltransferase/acyl carrier protein